MINYVKIILVLFILLGLLGMFVALKYPRNGSDLLAQRLEQKMFKRGYMTLSVCSGALGLLWVGVLEPEETLIITFGLLLAAEYVIARMAKHS